MSNKNKKHLGYEVLALALFLGGAFFAVSALMSMRDGGGIPQNPTTEAVTALLGLLGVVPFLGISLGAAGLGAIMFLRPALTALRLPVTLIVSYTLAGSLLLGVFGVGHGGSVGAWLPGALGGIVGVLAGVLLSFAVALLGSWVALGMPALPKPKKAGELNSISAALKEDVTDGVSNAEAAALFPETTPSPVAAPGVREYEQRARGELPEGVKPLGDAEPVPIPEAATPVETATVIEPMVAKHTEPLGLAAQEAPDRELSDGVWVRDDEVGESIPSPAAPSWETAALEDEALEPTDAIAEDGERFDEFEVEVPLETVDELIAGVPEFLKEEEVASEETEVEEVAAELEEELEDEDLEDELEETEVEEVAAELEEELEDEDLEDELEETEVEEVAAELEEELEDEDLEDELEETEVEEVAAELDEELEDEDLDDEVEETEVEEVAAELEEELEDEDLDDAVEEVAAELEEELEDEDLDDELEETEVEEVAAELEEELEDEDLDDELEDEVEEVAAELEEEEADAVLGALGDVFEGDVADAAAEIEEIGQTSAPLGTVEQPGLFDEHDSNVARTEALVEASSEAEEAALTPEPVVEPVVEPAAELEAEEPELAAVELTPAAPVEDAEVVAEAVEEAPEQLTVELTREELVYLAGALFLKEGRVAVSMLQRRFDLEFSQATEVLDALQSMGLIGPYVGGSRRDILMTTDEWEQCAATR